MVSLKGMYDKVHVIVMLQVNHTVTVGCVYGLFFVYSCMLKTIAGHSVLS